MIQSPFQCQELAAHCPQPARDTKPQLSPSTTGESFPVGCIPFDHWVSYSLLVPLAGIDQRKLPVASLAQLTALLIGMIGTSKLDREIGDAGR